MVTRLTFALSLALALGCVPAAADSVAYVVNGSQLGTLDLNTGAFQVLAQGPPDGLSGLVPGPNGTVLSLTFAGNLDSINPSTGAITVIGPTGLADELGNVGNSIYATDFVNNLYSVDSATGEATLIGPTGIPGLTGIPFSVNADGTLNVYDESIFGAAGKLYISFDTLSLDPATFQPAYVNVQPSLYQVDPLTGNATLIAPTALGLGAALDVSGTTYSFEDPTGQVVGLNVANGSTSFVSNFDPDAGIINGASPVPEPAAFGFAAIGIAALLASRRRFWRVRTSLSICTTLTAALGALLVANVPARAGTINFTYSLTGTGTVTGMTSTTLDLLGNYSGSIDQFDPAKNAVWNPVTYTDVSQADFSTGLLNGTFSITFANGEILSGVVGEDVSALISSPDGTGPYTQTLTFTGGTGEFAGANGYASGTGFNGPVTGTVSGTGTLNAPGLTTPEPGSAALMFGGLVLIALRRRTGTNRRPTSV